MRFDGRVIMEHPSEAGDDQHGRFANAQGSQRSDGRSIDRSPVGWRSGM